MEMELHIWPSDFGLPSVDVQCLQFLAAARICASPVAIVSASAPWNSPTGEYPVVFDKSKSDVKPITDFEKFVDVLRKSGQDYVIDADLTIFERSELDAFGAYLQQHLQPALLYTLWVDDLNYTTVTSFWYNRRLHFPYNLYYLEKRRKKAKRCISERTETQIMKSGLQAINMLSAKLGDNKYMCGDKPSSLDALVFGYLAPLLRLPLPNDRLQLHLSACPNLVRFVETVASIYLPLTEEQLKEQKADRKMWQARLANAEKIKEVERVAKEQAEAVPADDSSWRDTILFGLAALTLSAAFMIHSGMVQVVYVDEDDNPITETAAE
ncbi:hypothetical protein WR25_02534 [Diploscapter pachys]|uniref:GST C-terminal domain-containing protein n=1 Tax=Diploscapter pachys TaxID=2018661 RepID=A0A2A2KUF7_9BILA|nr:hypothetical protein WR25_02534 [Diploscapter pachys]